METEVKLMHCVMTFFIYLNFTYINAHGENKQNGFIPRRSRLTTQTFDLMNTDVPFLIEDHMSSVHKKYENSYQGQDLNVAPKQFRPRKQRERVRLPFSALQSNFDNKQNTFVPKGIPGSYMEPYKSYHNSEISHNEDKSAENMNPKSPIDLKNILKNSKGLSLSEILQQNSLSLDDLLNGKQNALVALQMKPTTVADKNIYMHQDMLNQGTKGNSSNKASSYRPNSKAQPPGVSKYFGSSKIIATAANDPNIHKSPDYVSNKNRDFASALSLRENQHSPFKHLQTNNKSRPIIQSSVSGHKQKNYTIDENLLLENRKNEQFFLQNNSTAPKNKIQPLFSTQNLSSINRLRHRPTIRLPVYTQTSKLSTKNPEKSDNITSEYFDSENNMKGLHFKDTDKTEKTTLIKNVFSTSEITEEQQTTEPTASSRIDSTSGSISYNSISNSKQNNFLQTAYAAINSKTNSPENFADPGRNDDRNDLLELLKNRRWGERLYKVLSQRNMTLDQLIAHRQRGSSQLHLAAVIHKKYDRKSESRSEMEMKSRSNDKLDIVTTFDNFPYFNLVHLKSVKPDEIKTDSEGSSYFTSIINIKPSHNEYGINPLLEDQLVDTQNYELTESTKIPMTTQQILSQHQHRNFSFPVKYNPFKSHELQEIPTWTMPRKVPKDINEAYQTSLNLLQTTSHILDPYQIDNNENIEFPLGIYSAIVASGVIGAVSLIIFLVIFLLFRWRQKKRRQLSYVEGYSRANRRFPENLQPRIEQKRPNKENSSLFSISR